MKKIICLLIIILNFNAQAEAEKSNYWEILSAELDTTITGGFTKVSIIIEGINSKNKLSGVRINSNFNNYLGQTDDNGELVTSFPSGPTRFCADTDKGGSFVKNYMFESRMSYVIKIKMRNKEFDFHFPSQAVKKPVIYLYPISKQNINVKVEPKGDFVFTYPIYPQKGWSVIGNPDGKIEYNNRVYNYLFWESESQIINQINLDQGFIVKSDTVVNFLEHTLTKVGLSDIEQGDFITYWAPQLQQNKYNFIHFEFNKGYDKYISEMEITPKPETLIRVFMTYKPYNILIENLIKPQYIPTYVRKGFTVVEWGGSKITPLKS